MEAISIPLPGGSATARCRSMNRLEDHIWICKGQVDMAPSKNVT
jgi:hypothetical protein